MCGLTGFWDAAGGAANDERLAALDAMVAALEHRGPDDRGTWIDERAGVGLGHRRLSIIDLSPHGHQPMVHPDGRHAMVYNGEVYNYRELADELRGQGARFRGGSDSEVVLEALVRWGVERSLERFNGMFALALWDGRELVLARDRLGIKPLYWGRDTAPGGGDRLLFGSELKALRAHPSFRPELDRGAAALFLRHNYVPEPHCIYAGVHKLEPGTWARFRSPRDVAISTFWSAREVALAGLADPLELGAHEAADAVEELLTRAVADRTIADVPLGAFLSGGIDSSTVVALLQKQASAPVRTFTIGFEEQGYDESGHARAVAAHLGTDHTSLTVTAKQAQEVVPTIAERWDEPFADSSQIPTFLVSQLARQHVTVSLSGDGGDELFGGYSRYANTIAHWKNETRVPALARSFGRAMASVGSAVCAGAPASRTRRRFENLRERLGVSNDQELYRRLVSHWGRPAELIRGVDEPATPLLDPTLRDELPGLLERMMLLDTVTYLPGDILCKVDRATMAVGLEARVPLLDHRVVELAWKLPRAVRVGAPPGKAVLRAVLDRHVPREVTDRPKMGFGLPIGAWLRGALREWAEELLCERRLAAEELLEPAPIRSRWTEHVEGRADWGYPLWNVLVLQAWRESWRV